MEAFGNFLKSLSETLNFTEETTNTEVDQVRRVSTFSESGYGSDTSRLSESSSTSYNESRRAQLRSSINNQAREDDDEEFETRGMRNSRISAGPNIPIRNPGSGISTGAVVGLAALAIGGYAIGKALFSTEKKISESKDEIVEKIKEIEEYVRQ